MTVEASFGRLALGGEPDRAPSADSGAEAAGRPQGPETSAGERRRRRQLSTQAHLVALVVVILLPLLLGGGTLLWRYAAAERARQHRDARVLAVELVADVDR